MLNMIFWKAKAAQGNGNILGYFLLRKLLHFHLNRWFQNIIGCWYFKVSKVVSCRYFGLEN
jgi:hypothetical protein